MTGLSEWIPTQEGVHHHKENGAAEEEQQDFHLDSIPGQRTSLDELGFPPQCTPSS